MQQILHNMALIMLTTFCREHSIDCSGTYCVKNGRGFTYSLRADPYSRAVDPLGPIVEIASITFHKSSVPTYQIH